MYGLVNYQLSGIQKGIQFGHAVVEYGNIARDLGGEAFKLYDKWARNDKTFIILNGGTTNENIDRTGTLQQHSEALHSNGVLRAEFREPDLNDTLTAVVFLVDEQIFNKIKYPDFIISSNASHCRPLILSMLPEYRNWLKLIGGSKNIFLREFLLNFKLA